MRSSMGSAGFSAEYCRNGPMGTMEPGRIYNGKVSTGAAVSTRFPAGLVLPLQKSYQGALPAGTYTDRVVALAVVTGVTMMDGPNRYWSPTFRASLSFWKSITSGRMNVAPLDVTCHATEKR